MERDFAYNLYVFYESGHLIYDLNQILLNFPFTNYDIFYNLPNIGRKD